MRAILSYRYMCQCYNLVYYAVRLHYNGVVL